MMRRRIFLITTYLYLCFEILCTRRKATKLAMGSTTRGGCSHRAYNDDVAKLLLPLLAGCAILIGTAAAGTVEPAEMAGVSAEFRVELYFQASVAAANTKPIISLLTVEEGGNIYLQDKDHPHPNLLHYNFRVTKIAADAITLDQIPDRRGKIQGFYTGSTAPVRQFRLEKGKPLQISLNVPGGGPVWNITWIGPGAHAKNK